MAKSRIKKIIIILLNMVLYLIYGKNIIFILLSSIIAYLLGKKVKENKKKFIISIIITLIPLLFFKYINSYIQINILVPLGISYYSLAIISYLSDVYKNKYSSADNIIDFLLYILYFPCLFIGPINRYNDFTKEINNLSFKSSNLFPGLIRICFGLIKKFIISNKLSIIIATLSFNLELRGLNVLFGCLIYTILLYCDFSGGIDIVMGISQIFNIHLKENFDRPYLSQSIKEFWRRWHISLGTWLKDYIYIPLGGNRRGSTKLNVIITFIISGLWHGIEYVLWGVINGIMVALNFKTKNKYINIFLTTIIISFLWIFFIYNDTFKSIDMFISIFKNINMPFNILSLGLNIWDYLIVLISFIMVLLYEWKNDWLMNLSLVKKIIVILFLVLIILLFGNYGFDVNNNNFIYGSF